MVLEMPYSQLEKAINPTHDIRLFSGRSNPKLAQEILGASYQDVYDFCNGDEELIAEEALAHLLQSSLINPKEPTKNSLFDRLRNFILNLFKGYNPSYVTDTIDSIRNLKYPLCEMMIKVFYK